MQLRKGIPGGFAGDLWHGRCAEQKRKEEEDAITKAREEAKEAKIRSAVERFAKALGVHGLHKTSYNDHRRNEPNVSARYSNIEISLDAVDHLIAFLDRIGA